MNKCKQCGKEYKLSLKDRLARRTAKTFSRKFPDLKAAIKETEGSCNTCFHRIVDPIANVYSNALKKGKNPEQISSIPAKLVLEQDGDISSHNIDFFDLDLKYTAKKLLRNKNIVNIDCEYEPLQVLNFITASKLDSKTKRKQVKAFKFIVEELKKNIDEEKGKL